MVARNAYFNLIKLGAVADRFHRHYYGDMADAINRGERSDRLEARWDLERSPDEPVAHYGPVEMVLGVDGADEAPEPSPLKPPTGEPIALVCVPPEYPAIREQDPALARRWRDAVAEAIETCLAAGMVASGFTRESAYMFTRRDQP